jgi:hypothetical protein
MAPSIPRDLSAFLTDETSRLLADRRGLDTAVQRRRRVAALIDPFESAPARRLTALLDSVVFPCMDRIERDLPASALPSDASRDDPAFERSLSASTGSLTDSRSPVQPIAEQTGLVELIRSPTVRQVAQRLSGYALGRELSVGVFCYSGGDHLGPHADRRAVGSRPIDPGVVGLNLCFPNDGVASQTLVWEQDGTLDQAVALDGRPAVFMLRLPFWHYVTPLLAKPGRERDARRWVLTASYEIAAPLD